MCVYDIIFESLAADFTAYLTFKYRHPLNFAVNVNIGDLANIKTAKMWTYSNPCS